MSDSRSSREERTGNLLGIIGINPGRGMQRLRDDSRRRSACDALFGTRIRTLTIAAITAELSPVHRQRRLRNCLQGAPRRRVRAFSFSEITVSDSGSASSRRNASPYGARGAAVRSPRAGRARELRPASSPQVTGEVERLLRANQRTTSKTPLRRRASVGHRHPFLDHLDHKLGVNTAGPTQFAKRKN